MNTCDVNTSNINTSNINTSDLKAQRIQRYFVEGEIIDQDKFDFLKQMASHIFNESTFTYYLEPVGVFP